MRDKPKTIEPTRFECHDAFITHFSCVGSTVNLNLQTGEISHIEYDFFGVQSLSVHTEVMFDVHERDIDLSKCINETKNGCTVFTIWSVDDQPVIEIKYDKGVYTYCSR